MLGVKPRQNASPTFACPALPLPASLRINWRYHLGGGSAAAAIGIYITEPSLISPLLPLSFCLLWASVLLLGPSKPSRAVLWCSLIIAVSVWLAVPFTLISDRPLAPTLALAVFTSVLFPLTFASQVKAIFYWLIPAWYIQAAVMTWQWFAETHISRSDGIASNGNAGSAFVLMGAVFLLNHPRLKWLAVPLMIAIPFSGSRWVVAVGVAIIGMMFLSQRINWRYVLVGISAAFVLLLSAQHSQITTAFFAPRANHEPTAGARLASDTADRIAIQPTLAALAPSGFRDSSLHSVPIRMVDETGIISALAWVTASAVVMWRRRMDWQAWCLAAICLLSLMYYHTWVGAMGAFWWLLITGQKYPSRRSL